MDALYFQHRPEAMAELDEQTQALLDEVGTQKQRADYYSRLSQMVLLQNRYRMPNEKIHLARKAYALAKESHNPALIARQQFHVGFSLGFSQLWQDNLNEAIGFLQASFGHRWRIRGFLAADSMPGLSDNSVSFPRRHDSGDKLLAAVG